MNEYRNKLTGTQQEPECTDIETGLVHTDEITCFESERLRVGKIIVKESVKNDVCPGDSGVNNAVREYFRLENKPENYLYAEFSNGFSENDIEEFKKEISKKLIEDDIKLLVSVATLEHELENKKALMQKFFSHVNDESKKDFFANEFKNYPLFHEIKKFYFRKNTLVFEQDKDNQNNYNLQIVKPEENENLIQIGTNNFYIKIRDDSSNQEEIKQNLPDYISKNNLNWIIEGINHSGFYNLSGDFWDYKPANLCFNEDYILLANADPKCKNAEEIANDLNICTNTGIYKSEGESSFFFPFCAEGNKVFAKKLNNFITALDANDVTVTLCGQNNTCRMTIKCVQDWDAFLKDVEWNNESNDAAKCFRNLIRIEGNKDYPKPQICSYDAKDGELTISWEKEQITRRNKNEKQ